MTDTTAQPAPPIVDVTQDTFDAEVIAASHTAPVVVDFWAEWCGPCHQLAPLLEQAAMAHTGEVVLVKVDVDANPGLAQRFKVQGIPAVKAFRGGAVVAEFTGVQPQATVDRLFASLAPTQADRLVTRAEAEADDAARQDLLRQALAADANHARANVAMARLMVGTGETDQARQLLRRVPGDAHAQRLAAELDLGAEGPLDDVERARLAAAAADGDAGAAFTLGTSLAGEGSYDEALIHLLAAVRHPDHKDAARERLLAVFAVLGDDDPRVAPARRRLASALF